MPVFGRWIALCKARLSLSLAIEQLSFPLLSWGGFLSSPCLGGIGKSLDFWVSTHHFGGLISSSSSSSPSCALIAETVRSAWRVELSHQFLTEVRRAWSAGRSPLAKGFCSVCSSCDISAECAALSSSPGRLICLSRCCC